jgi:hypothetical protein
MTQKDFLVLALLSFCGNKQGMFHFAGVEDYDNLVWETAEYAKPSKELTESKMEELSLLWNALGYQRQRAAEYPPMSDYLDAVVKGDQAQIDVYVAACLAVKAKYPKPPEA